MALRVGKARTKTRFSCGWTGQVVLHARVAQLQAQLRHLLRQHAVGLPPQNWSVKQTQSRWQWEPQWGRGSVSSRGRFNRQTAVPFESGRGARNRPKLVVDLVSAGRASSHSSAELSPSFISCIFSSTS